MMSQPILMTVAVLLVAVFLFVTQRLRADLVALLVLVSLVLMGLVTPLDALSGFSNPAVVAVGAFFILSAGLSGTGVIHGIGRLILRLSGRGEMGLVVVVMGTAVFLSAFINNIAVAALLMPIVLTIARQTKLPSSKLLLPLAMGCLLGGMITLLSSPANLLASDALRQYRLEPFQLFDFAPLGIIIALVTIIFMAVIGRYLLPEHHPAQTLSGHSSEREEAKGFYGLMENLVLVSLPTDSPLAGKTLAATHIGQALGLTILGLQRHGRKQMRVEPDTILAGGDQLLAVGRLDRLTEVNTRPLFVVEEGGNEATQLFSSETGLAELKIHGDSPLIGHSIADIDMRRRYHFNVLAIRHEGAVQRTKLQQLPLLMGDTLLLQGNRAELLAARLVPEFAGGLNVFVAERETAVHYHIQERLLVIRIPPNSTLVGQSLAQSHLGDLFGMVALGIMRNGQSSLAPSPDTVLNAGDVLLVEGEPEELTIVRSLQGLIVKRHLHLEQVELESETVGLVEVVLSPHTTLVQKTLRDLRFRERYGLSVLAIWRDGRIFRSDLGDILLRFGDAFLLYGSREKINLLSREPDFLLLTEELPEVPRRQKAPLAVLIMIAVLSAALLGWLPISIAAVAGATLMVLSGCLPMEEAYAQVDWRTIFLMAGMLPLAMAMEQSGAAQLLAEGLVALAGGWGIQALFISLFVLTSAASHFMPNIVVMILLAPVALNTAEGLGLSPYALLMVLVIAASTAFMSPAAHPINLLVLNAGGYRRRDYVRVGLPLAVVILVVTLLLLPLVWPLAI